MAYKTLWAPMLQRSQAHSLLCPWLLNQTSLHCVCHLHMESLLTHLPSSPRWKAKLFMRKPLKSSKLRMSSLSKQQCGKKWLWPQSWHDLQTISQRLGARIAPLWLLSAAGRSGEAQQGQPSIHYLGPTPKSVGQCNGCLHSLAMRNRARLYEDLISRVFLSPCAAQPRASAASKLSFVVSCLLLALRRRAPAQTIWIDSCPLTCEHRSSAVVCVRGDSSACSAWWHET